MLGAAPAGALSRAKTERVRIMGGAGAGGEKNNTLFEAARSGKTEDVIELVRAGANLEAKDMYGRTPLMIAANNGNAEAVRALVKAGANLEAKDGNGDKALMLAAAMDKTAAVSQAIEDGKQALIEQFNEDKERVLAFCLVNNHLETASPPLPTFPDLCLREICSNLRTLSKIQKIKAQYYAAEAAINIQRYVRGHQARRLKQKQQQQH